MAQATQATEDPMTQVVQSHQLGMTLDVLANGETLTNITAPQDILLAMDMCVGLQQALVKKMGEMREAAERKGNGRTPSGLVVPPGMGS